MMISGKVAEIIDERKLAINVGSKKGVKLGMIFQVYSPLSKTVRDPDTGDELGEAAIPLIQVKVVDVRELFSIGETFKYERINVGGINPTAALGNRLFSPPKYIKQYETLELGEGSAKELQEERSKVKIGYEVRSIDATN